MNKNVLIAVALALLLLAILNWGFSGLSINKNSLFVSGNIEVTEVEASFEIPGRVKQRLVEEGDYVKKGQEIAILDSRALEQEVAMHRAEVAAAEAALLELERGYRIEEIKQAEAKVEQTKADLNRFETDYKRQQNLFNTNVISQKEFDLSVAAYNVAKAKYDEANENFTLLRTGVRIEKIDQARAKLKETQEALALAETKLGYAVIHAPIEGWVLSKSTEAGEVVAAGTPIVSLGNLSDIWLRAYIHEAELGKIKLGQKVNVTTSSFPNKTYDGRIIFVSSEAEFTPKNVQTERERVKLVYRIKVKLDNPNQELKPGMPADGRIVLEE